MRRQSGTTSLRALFYMDEVFGYFPPSAMPPSKTPLLTLMKQARAFGLGVVLATQNPVDLDYKGLGNAGTWFIGRLQTERDKARVIEGLLGSDAAGGMDKSQLEAAMSSLPQRTFLMRNVHDAAPVLLRTRWALSYLRGPLTSAEIAKLAASDGQRSAAPAPAPKTEAAPVATLRASAMASGSRPIVPAGVPEKFMAAAGNQGVEYEPRIGARVRAHFVDAKAGLDAWENWYYLAPLTAQGPDWEAAEICNADVIQLLDAPAANATFADVAGSAIAARAFAQHGKSLADHVYRTSSLSIMRCPDLKVTSAPGGSESEFRAHLALALREKRDAAVDALRKKYASKLDAIEDRARRAEQKLMREKEQASQQTMSSALSVGGSLLGALFGGRRGSAFGKASSAAKSMGRIGKERTDVTHAEADLTALQQQHAALEAELADEIAVLESKFDAGAITVEQSEIKARKSDTEVTDLALVWQPA
jgi:Skp family chaperone for outer membrane proteins